jgi:probable HAF family extracellular repeat protein
VVGDSSIAGNGASHAFLYSGGSMTDLGALSQGWLSSALGINNSGEIVGESHLNGGTPHAFLYANGSMQDLNNLIPAGSGWDLEWASSINDRGQIVGWGTINGETHAFLLDEVQPVPAPPSLVLAAIGALALVGYRWRSYGR